MTASRLAYRTCPLCEATCGLELHLADDDSITLVRGDRDDVSSHGFLCPKGTAIKALEADTDRLRAPQVRDRATGEWRDASWDEAFALIEERLTAIIERDGRNAVGVYVGNPNAHNLGALVYLRALIQSLATTNVFTASTIDQMPKHVSSGLMFGAPLSIPVPDVDRTQFLVMVGANPFESNGSLMTAPDFPGRIAALRARDGRFVVVDPRRTKTAEAADEHHPIRPGTDAWFLFGIVHTLFDEGLAHLGSVEGYVEGVGEVERLAKDFPPEVVAGVCGIDATAIRELARALAREERSVVYGRIGTTLSRYGTLASWLVDVVNVLVGSLDRPGGAMFTTPAAGGTAFEPDGAAGGRGFRVGRRHSRVRGLPEAMGELPVACLVEEITTPGDGQIRAFVTVAGNPVLSSPDGRALDAALASLEFMVSVDVYRNETTRHADVILPVPGVLGRSHYDLALYHLSVRNVANYSPVLVAPTDGGPYEWEILLRLAGIASGVGASADLTMLDDFVISTLVQHTVAAERSAVAGLDPAEIVAMLGDRRGPERVLDFMLRVGPYGEGFGAKPDGLTLAVLEANPHGLDLGPLQPRIPGILRTASGMVELAPEWIVADVDRLRADLDAYEVEPFVLIGRRDLRSNNSWMHNLPVLVKGEERCTLHVHPDDAERVGLVDDGRARVENHVGAVELPVEVTDRIRPGVVSIPHGWGHGAEGMSTSVAGARPGVNVNVLTDRAVVDPLSGTASLNGTPVRVLPA